jgi:hypothetical protein
MVKVKQSHVCICDMHDRFYTVAVYATLYKNGASGCQASQYRHKCSRTDFDPSRGRYQLTESKVMKGLVGLRTHCMTKN